MTVFQHPSSKMIRFGLFFVLCHLAAVYGQTVMFPNEVMDEPKTDVNTRTGLKYLGKYG